VVIDHHRIWKEWGLVLSFALLKLIIHLIFIQGYGFHRDEFLYLDDGNHMDWGFMEVPPFTPLIGKIAQILFGASLFSARIFPALVGALNVVLIGVMVKDLGGKKWALIFACTAFLISPAFLRTHHLFQPVAFNQFWWFLSAVLLVRIVKYREPRYWYFLGLVAGIGFMTKYSIVFMYLAFLVGLLVTRHRTWINTKHAHTALAIAFFIALPNLLWQYGYGWPVLKHMEELARNQLVNVSPLGFLEGQLLFHFASTIIWLGGLIYLFLPHSNLKDYRFLGWSYIFLLVILLALSGKAYYTLGIYPMLIAVGGVAWEHWLAVRKRAWNYLVVFLIVGINLISLPYGIPILPIESMQKYAAYMKENWGLARPLTWEDGKVYPLPQDYADMHGWEEMAFRVAKFYHSLGEEEKKKCNIWGGSYAHAGTLNYYRQKYNLPEVYSFVGSYLLWVPDSIEFDRQILVDDVLSLESQYFNQVQLIDSIRDPYAREKGYIYYRTDPKVDVQVAWAELVRRQRKEKLE